MDPSYTERTSYDVVQFDLSGYARDSTVLIACKGWDIHYAENYDEDVAVLKMDPRKTNSIPKVSPNWVQAELFLTDANFGNEIELCDRLAMPGYPEYFDQRNYKAIIRSGTVASDPNDNYSGPGQSDARRIAVEAMSTSGHSGAPVFALPKQDRNFRNLKLIGVNAGHFRMTGVGSNEGLSYFYRSQVVLDIFEKLGLKLT